MKKSILVPAALAVCGLLFGTFAIVQSDETNESKESKTIEKKVEVKVIGDVDANSVTIDGDKIKVRLPNGETQTIDLSSIKKGLNGIEIDGGDIDVDVQVQGKAVIIGPDGEVQEYDLSDEELDIELPKLGDARSIFKRFRGQLPPGLEAQIFPPGIDSREIHGEPIEVLPVSEFMIGVAMGPTSETLQAQLGLDNPGIAVLDVMPDSPAASAGIKKHDVLVSSGNQILKQMSDLVSAVDKAGTDKTDLTLKLIRQGKTMDVNVTPTKRPENQARIIEAKPYSGELSEKQLREHLKRFGAEGRWQAIPDGHLLPDVDGEFIELEELQNLGGFEDLLEAIERLGQRIQKLEENDASK